MEQQETVLDITDGSVAGTVPVLPQAVSYGPVYEVLRDLGYNDGWYSAMKWLERFPDIMVYWIIGERRIGKTDLFLHAACELFIRYRLKTMWVRNKLEELKGSNVSTFLNDAVNKGWCPPTWVVDEKGVRESEDRDAEPIILFSSISTFSNRRGGAHPDVVMMVLDEFCPEDRRYPRMAAEGLMSLTKTVFSGREDARLFCLSNFTEFSNPYFVRMRIFPAKGKDVTYFPEKRMLIERCRGYKKAIERTNPWNDVYTNTGIGNYADEDEDDMMRLISRVPKGLKDAPFLVRIDGIDYIRRSGSKGVWWTEYKGNLRMATYTPNLKECTDDVALAPRYLIRDISDCLEAGVLRFSHPNVMFAVLNMVYDAV